MMIQQLDRERLAKLVQAENIEAFSFPDLVELVRGEISEFLPDGVYRVDPRNGDLVLYHSSRARRPHDNQPPPTEIVERACVICQGRTTSIVDVAELSEGFTFINLNLFPVVYPLDGAGQTYGLHFLQWTSSQHDKDWHNMPLADCVVVMKRLAALEKKLLTGSRELTPDRRGFVAIIKNYGRLVGGSLAHGHQQIAFGNVMPRRFWDNWRFEQERGETFSAYLLRENSPALVVKDYGPAILLTPYFMRRPYDMMLLVKDTGKQHLHQLTGAEIAAVAEGWRDATRAIHAIMPRIGREIAYNVVVNNGPGAGLYFEFLPYTQEIGGVEHLGLFICQELPERAAARARENLEEVASDARRVSESTG
jgi:galactose-1-phosphate uridylyltransferase